MMPDPPRGSARTLRTMHRPKLNLPPGSTGLPLLGETLDFMKDPFRFLERKVMAHGPISKTSLLGKKTAVMSGCSSSNFPVSSVPPA